MNTFKYGNKEYNFKEKTVKINDSYTRNIEFSEDKVTIIDIVYCEMGSPLAAADAPKEIQNAYKKYLKREEFLETCPEIMGFTALNLSEEDQSLILNNIQVSFEEIVNHHITLAFNIPKPNEDKTFNSVEVVGHCKGEDIECLVVEINGNRTREDGSIYHVTLSKKKDVENYMSNHILKTEEIKEINPITINPVWSFKELDPYYFIKKEMKAELLKYSPTNSCLKQVVKAVIRTEKGELVFGSNDINVELDSCPRVEKGCKTGEGYELCKKICKQKSHAEITAIQNAKKQGIDIKNGTLFLVGHTYCCENCLDGMKKAGLKKAFVLESEIEYDL